MLMPSETDMVVKARGVPPMAAATPACACPACVARLPLQGLDLPGGTHNADEGPCYRIVVEPHAAHEGTMRRPIDTFGW